MSGERIVVARAPFDMEDPWLTPSSCLPVSLRHSTDGGAPRLATTVAAWYDDACLTLLFSAQDDAIHASHLEHDAPLYEQDVVEVFLAPQVRTRYFEIEVSPRGTIFDARIESPDGVRGTMRVDREWNCEGLLALIRKVTAESG